MTSPTPTPTPDSPHQILKDLAKVTAALLGLLLITGLINSIH